MQYVWILAQVMVDATALKIKIERSLKRGSFSQNILSSSTSRLISGIIETALKRPFH